MESVLARSRVPLSLLPPEVVTRAARETRIKLEELDPERQNGGVVLANTDKARILVDHAIPLWWELISRWTRLNFTMQHQEQTQWCWAATSVSVSLFYSSWSGWTQCEMVNAELGQTTCCTNGSTAQCNQPNVLDSPLDRADVLDHMQSGTVSYADIGAEIDAGRPLAWRIGWSGGGGHFAVIEGYRHFGEEWVAVDDPWYGQSDQALSTLTGGTYQGTGTWTHTYFTTPAPFVWVPPHELVFTFPWEIWQLIQREGRVPIGGEVE